MIFKITNKLKFNNDHIKLNDDFKCNIMVEITLKGTLVLFILLLNLHKKIYNPYLIMTAGTMN